MSVVLLLLPLALRVDTTIRFVVSLFFRLHAAVADPSSAVRELGHAEQLLNSTLGKDPRADDHEVGQELQSQVRYLEVVMDTEIRQRPNEIAVNESIAQGSRVEVDHVDLVSGIVVMVVLALHDALPRGLRIGELSFSLELHHVFVELLAGLEYRADDLEDLDLNGVLDGVVAYQPQERGYVAWSARQHENSGERPQGDD
mmetsp:Transcript_23812/g.47403  ORF Transcript_23812/g.47403 Transcript_23812/m.47403 type:complete len:200 (+) Transcript_23812:2854-3453(+)